MIDYFTKNELKIVATGTGRCGTTYVAKLLTSLGINCGHESVFDYSNDEIIKKRIVDKNYRTLSKVSQIDNDNWINPKTITADSSYMAAPYLDWPELKKVKVIHVIRNPLNVIRSFVLDFKYFNKNMPDKKNIFNELGFEEKIWKILPELSTIQNKFERGCYFYIYWNKMIEEKIQNKKSIRINIEDKNKVNKIANFINKPEITFMENNTNSFENITKKKPSKEITLDDIPDGEIKNELLKMMEKYGY
jgi:hypothetical protein